MDVLRLVVQQGMKPVMFGLAIGVAAALAVGPIDRVAAVSNLGLQSDAAQRHLVDTWFAALFACLFPARRATLVNPVEALRTE